MDCCRLRVAETTSLASVSPTAPCKPPAGDGAGFGTVWARCRNCPGLSTESVTGNLMYRLNPCIEREGGKREGECEGDPSFTAQE